jgi:hypothetical protein
LRFADTSFIMLIQKMVGGIASAPRRSLYLRKPSKAAPSHSRQGKIWFLAEGQPC